MKWVIYRNHLGVAVFSMATITILGAALLSGATSNNAHASTTATANASITVLDSCTAGTTDHTYNRTLTLGATETITGTDISVTCNDYSGFDLYAVGYSGDSYEDTNTDMISSLNSSYNIKTNGTGNNSYWKMKIEEKNTTNQVDITSAFASFTTIPADYTKIASRASSTSTGGVTITPTYQIHVSTSQPAGTYTGKVKYTIVHPNGTAAPTKPVYIQDLTLADCQTKASSGNITVYDKRDEKDYTVRYINGECWMTQNLRYLGDTGSAAGTMTIGGGNSNVANGSITLYSLDSSNAGNFNAYDSNKCGSGSTAGNYNACVYDSGSTSTGVWYNYYAATAGTISGSSNSTEVSQDICPKNWHLPTGPNTTADADINKLVGNTTFSWQNPTTGLTVFSAVAGGSYYNGSLGNTGYGYWWSATANGDTYRYYLDYDSSYGQFRGSSSSYRRLGLFIRCVRSS